MELFPFSPSPPPLPPLPPPLDGRSAKARIKGLLEVSELPEADALEAARATAACWAARDICSF